MSKISNWKIARLENAPFRPFPGLSPGFGPCGFPNLGLSPDIGPWGPCGPRNLDFSPGIGPCGPCGCPNLSLSSGIDHPNPSLSQQ